jgi:hypothetical protein
MSFKEGEQSGKECPKCEAPMVYEMSFTDQFSHTSGHYTTDCPLIVCTKCTYTEDYIEDEEVEE